MTPKQAKTKWCPHYQYVVNYPAVTTDGAMPVYAPNYCIADACMMWRKAGGYCGLAGAPTVPVKPVKGAK